MFLTANMFAPLYPVQGAGGGVVIFILTRWKLVYVSKNLIAETLISRIETFAKEILYNCTGNIAFPDKF